MMNIEQYEKMAKDAGFVAALDQSGGSTPKALRLYGIGEDEYSNDEEMFELMHQMRTRIITSPSFDGNRILGGNPVREHDGPQHRGPSDRRLSVERQENRADPQGRQGASPTRKTAPR